MSLRYLYRKAPWERICTGCGRVIQRNIALHGTQPWHYGCLQEAKRKKYRCRSCGAMLNTLETVKVTVIGRDVRSCGFCGSTGVIPIYTWTPPEVNVIPEGST
jgi:hypothetical protein